MPNAAPSARYDSLWKAALTHAFRAFMGFFFPELGAQIDWTKRPRFRDKELAGINLGGKPDGLVADKLVEVALRNGLAQWVASHNPFAWITLAHLRTQQAWHDKGWRNGSKKGIEQGIEQGLARGRKEGALALLERQLTCRFGALPKTVRSKLAKATLAQLEAWSDALPTSQSLKQVFD